MEKKLEILMKRMEDINYGFVGNGKNIYPDDNKNWDKNFSKYYKLQILSDVLKTKYGVCWDQVELERYLLNEMHIKSKSYFIVEYDDKICPTHTFIVVKDDNYYYWFEHSWYPYRGIHKFNNLNELLLDIKEKFVKMLQKQKIDTENIIIYEYTEPKEHLNCIDFYKHCEMGKIIFKNNHFINKDWK